MTLHQILKHNINHLNPLEGFHHLPFQIMVRVLLAVPYAASLELVCVVHGGRLLSVVAASDSVLASVESIQKTAGNACGEHNGHYSGMLPR